MVSETDTKSVGNTLKWGGKAKFLGRYLDQVEAIVKVYHCRDTLDFIAIGYCPLGELSQNFPPSVLWPNSVGSIQIEVVQLGFLLLDYIYSDPSYFRKEYLLQAFDWFDSSNPLKYC